MINKSILKDFGIDQLNLKQLQTAKDISETSKFIVNINFIPTILLKNIPKYNIEKH